MKLKLLFAGYILVVLGLFFYTFTQIDLSLALSRVASVQAVVVAFQHIGYFERPLSADLFVSITILLFIFYILFLRIAAKKKLEKKLLWKIIISTTVILALSYNAFSYDIFNYIFDAKIVTHYQQNPYIHKALDFPQDPMLSFMRWTHREYPYGPVWLGITIPLSFIGFQYFLPTFVLFKVLMAVSFIGSAYCIGKIFQIIAPEKEIFGLVFFALNPLMLIESLVSGHIDIVMMFFALLGLYLLLIQKRFISYLSFIASIGIKFVTGFIAPIFLYIHYLLHKKKKINWDFIFSMCLVLLIVGVIVQSQRGTFQPWYLIDALTFAVFLSHRYIVLIPSVVISFIALLNYVPFLYTGNWDKPIPQILANMNLFSYCLAFFLVAVYFFYRQIVFARNAKKLAKNDK